jgi:E3 Ubiquitin ligase
MLHTMLIAGAFLLAIAAGTLGFAYEEWIIRPDAQLYVHGTVSDKTGRPGFAEDGRYIISSRSEDEIVGQAESVALWATIGAGAAGVVLLVRGLVA